MINLNNDDRILIHCAAGIHRTGVFAYSFIRNLGNDVESSRGLLQMMREVTFKGVGEDRLKYAEMFLVKETCKLIVKDKEEETDKILKF